MATKLKNNGLPLLTLLLLTFGLNGSMNLLSNGDYYLKGYYQTSSYQVHLNNYLDYLSFYEVEPISESTALNQASAPNQSDQAPASGNTVQSSNQSALPTQQQSITSSQKAVQRIQQAIKEAYRMRQENKGNLARELSSFQYYLKDTNSGQVFTDLNTGNATTAEGYLQTHQTNFQWVERYPSSNNGYLSLANRDSNLDASLVSDSRTAFSGFIAVPNVLPTTSTLYFEHKHFMQARLFFMIYGVLALLSLGVSLYLIFRKRVLAVTIPDQWQTFYNRLSPDLAGVVLLITGFYTLFALLIHHSTYDLMTVNIFQVIESLLVKTVVLGLTLLQVVLIKNRRQDHRQTVKGLWESSLLYKTFNGVGEGLGFSSTGLQVLWLAVVLVCSGVGIPICASNSSYWPIYLFLFIVVTLPTLLMTVKRIGQFNAASLGVERLVSGQTEDDLPVRGWSALKNMIRNINALRRGISSAKKEMSKSERLKTELITNVSHDLRTPLTSIITYTELLQKKNVTDEERTHYIQIIDQKSKRLNVLIEDLFEASKMASGDVELDVKRVDLVQLLQQALAESDERIQASNLQFRFSAPDHPIYVQVDGQKLWRVFDNLIGNCMKYAFEDTRVFIEVREDERSGRAVISFKNTSKYEISENLDELFERFKRGDASRHTEGSGLGLAIAKSIVDLHGGDLDIEVDGDLFKVTVALERV